MGKLSTVAAAVVRMGQPGSGSQAAGTNSLSLLAQAQRSMCLRVLLSNTFSVHIGSVPLLFFSICLLGEYQKSLKIFGSITARAHFRQQSP